ncbi:MAG: hypothetical protein J6B72_03265 [Clostridia bacterium]|nr:hypothetical protein [Clostridia bacterium]
MFGYVKVEHSELKVREYEAYRGVYCGLCRSMGKCTGQCSRMTLSYDFAFLALLRMCLENTEIKFSPRRCLAHPLKKRSMMERNAVLDYCSRTAAILNYHKIKDDLSDERGFKRLRAVLAYPLVAHARKKALKAGPSELDAKISEGLRSLAELEARALPSVDAPAEIFGNILADIVSFGLEESAHRIARAVGKSVGKWIYIIDALDDLSDDEKKKRYNPFLLLYGGVRPTEEQMALISDALKVELCSAEAALDLMETERAAMMSILENIMYLGMPNTAKRIIDDNKDQKKGINVQNE